MNTTESILIECECSDLGHTIRFCVDTSDTYSPLWVDFPLNQYLPWYKRITLAIKYIFGYQSKFGAYDVTLISRENGQKIIRAIQTAYPSEDVATTVSVWQVQ